MTDEQWQIFFQACARILGPGHPDAARSSSWCAWTTFTSLLTGVHYWSCGLPDFNDIDDRFIKDGGVWGQPFSYRDLAHVIVPREIFWEAGERASYSSGTRHQDLAALSAELSSSGIQHRLTDLVLEVKLY